MHPLVVLERDLNAVPHLSRPRCLARLDRCGAALSTCCFTPAQVLFFSVVADPAIHHRLHFYVRF